MHVLSEPYLKAPKQEVSSIIVVGCSSEKCALMLQSKDNEWRKDGKTVLEKYIVVKLIEVYVDESFAGFVQKAAYNWENWVKTARRSWIHSHFCTKEEENSKHASGRPSPFASLNTSCMLDVIKLGSTQLCVYTILCCQCSVNESGLSLVRTQVEVNPS